MDETSQDTSLTLFSVILSLVAVIAFVGLVFLRTASTVAVVAPSTSSTGQSLEVAPQLLTQVMTQEQANQESKIVSYIGPDLPPNNALPILLIPGSLSTPLQFRVDFSDAVSIPAAIQQENAQFVIVAVRGDQAQQSCNQNDGTHCWTAQYSGADLSVVTAASPDPNEVNGHFLVPISLPYFAEPGIWTLWWSITPVDAKGMPLTGLVLTNDSAPMRFVVPTMTAFDVSSILNYSVQGLPMKPDEDSDPLRIVARQEGNVPLDLYLYGNDWQCSSGQRMPVTVTRFTGGSQLTWQDPHAQILTRGVATKMKIIGDSGADWKIPLTEGNMLGGESLSGKNTYLTMIHPGPDISGTCSSTLMNIAAESL